MAPGSPAAERLSERNARIQNFRPETSVFRAFLRIYRPIVIMSSASEPRGFATLAKTDSDIWDRHLGSDITVDDAKVKNVLNGASRWTRPVRAIMTPR